MSSSSDQYVPFSQRTGIEPIPPQLELGVVSPDMRRQFAYYIGLEIDRLAHTGLDHAYFDGGGKRFAMDLHVLFLKQIAETFQNSPYETKK